MVLVVLASIIGATLLVSVITKKDLCLCFFATVPGIVAALYIGGFLGPLRLTAVVLFYAGLAAGPTAIALALIAKRGRALLGEVLSPGPAIFTVSAAAYWAAYHDGTFLFWDEFNNWGLAIKEMLLTDSLPTAASINVFQDYPRGTALFQYFFVRNSSWSEGVVCFAQFVLAAAPLLVLFRGCRWKRVHWLLLTVSFVLEVCFITGNWLRVIYVDFALSGYFGAVLIVYFTSERKPPGTAMLIPALFVMPLIKTPGFGFALVCAAIIYADLLLRRLFEGATDASMRGALAAARRKIAGWARSARQSVAAAKEVLRLLLPRRADLGGHSGPRRSRARATALALVALAPLLAHGSWQLWVSANHIRISHYFGPGRSYLTALHVFDERAGVYANDTGRAMIAALSRRPIGLSNTKTIYGGLRKRWAFPQQFPPVKRLATLEYLAISLALFAIAFWMLPSAEARLRLVVTVLILCAGFAAYLVCLLADYLMGINPSSGHGLLEFHRYSWAYLMPVVLLAWALVAAAGQSPGKTGRMRAAIPFAALFAFVGYLYVFENAQYFIVPTNPDRAPQNYNVNWRPLRAYLRPRIDLVRAVAKPDEMTYIVFRNAMGATFLFTGYEFYPWQTNARYWTEKTTRYPHDPIAWKIPAEKWRRMLTRFSYVFIATGDHEFWAQYKSLFDPYPRRGEFLFRVVHAPSGETVLKPVR